MAEQGVSAAERPLRRAHEVALTALVAALKRGRFVIVVADEATWPAARARIADAIADLAPTDVRLVTGEDVLRALAAGADSGTMALAIDAAAAGALETLNLHRDKLQQRGRRFVLWLDGLEAHRRFVRDAPDCYSFRDAVAILDAPVAARDGGVAVIGGAERAPDTLDVDAERARIDAGIAVFAGRKRLHAAERAELADLHARAAELASPEDALAHRRAEVAALEPVHKRVPARYARALAAAADAFGPTVKAATAALAAAPDDAALRADLEIALALAHVTRGGVVAARAALRAARPREQRAGRRGVDAAIAFEEGRWREVEELVRASLAHDDLDRGERARARALLAEVLLRSGEIDAARAVIASIGDGAARARFDLRARVALGEADAIEALRGPIVDAAAPAHGVVELARVRAHAVRACAGAGLVDAARERALGAELCALADRLAAEGAEPPWSRIRASLLAADFARADTSFGGDPAACLEHATRALADARRGAIELLPACSRRLASGTGIRGDAIASARAALEEAAAVARAQDLARERVRVSALAWVTDAAEADESSSREAAFLDAIASSGSAIVEAEARLVVGRALGRRDLVERARALFRAMPWPLREATCLVSLDLRDAARERCLAFGLVVAARAIDRGVDAFID
ncbi:MAG TPA: hypothetical protein VGM56_34035 [Byssovorax sp.]